MKEENRSKILQMFGSSSFNEHISKPSEFYCLFFENDDYPTITTDNWWQQFSCVQLCWLSVIFSVFFIECECCNICCNFFFLFASSVFFFFCFFAAPRKIASSKLVSASAAVAVAITVEQLHRRWMWIRQW